MTGNRVASIFVAAFVVVAAWAPDTRTGMEVGTVAAVGCSVKIVVEEPSSAIAIHPYSAFGSVPNISFSSSLYGCESSRSRCKRRNNNSRDNQSLDSGDEF